MSTLKTINVIHPSGTTNNIVNDNLGSVTIGNNLTVTGNTTLGSSIVVPTVIGGTTASSTLTLESTSGTGTSDSILFKTGSQSTRMTIDTSGNVGIGTSSPSYLLHLNQAGNTQAWISATNSGSNSAGIGFENQGQRNWQIWADRTNDALQFGNNSRATVNMVINSSGNVGVGTSSPSSALSVARSSGEAVISITNSGTASSWLTLSPGSSGSAYIHNTGNTSTIFTTNGSERMRIDSSGNVGIGTSSPSYSLVVSKNQNAATVFQLVNNNTGASAASILQSQIGASSYVNYSTFAAYNQIVGSGITTQYIDFDTQIFRTTGGTESMRIDSSGNVGIGTSSTSTYKLNVNGVANFALGSGVYANNADMRLETATGYGWRMGTASTGSTLGYFYIQGSTDNFVSSFINSLYIDSSGNVGVGTSSPSGRLSFGTSAGFKGIQLYDDGSGASGFGITSNTLNVYSGGSTIAFGTGQTSAGTTLTSGSMYLVSGSLGIGTASPDASAILDAQSTTKGVRFPNMTTTQKNAISSPAAGLVVFDTTLAKLCVYSGSAWQTITSI